MIQSILAILKFLPEFIKLGEIISKAIQDGVTYLEIKKSLNNIDLAFKKEDPKERAKDLNEEFRKGI